jgi:hypothetical protein
MSDRYVPRIRARAAFEAALVVAAAACAAACTSERLSSSERLTLASQPAPGGERTVLIDDGGRRQPTTRLEVSPVARMPWSGRALPLVAPDGRKAVVETSGNLPWSVRVGDPLPPEGFETTIEAISLSPSEPGAPLTTLTGAWVLGRAATDSGFLVERPHEGGARDIVFVGWDGAQRVVAADGACNAHATASRDGRMAWCRRDPEGGDWQLVVEQDGERVALATEPGTSWLAPTFSGDGKGLFAIQLQSTALAVAWIPFESGGLPAQSATLSPTLLRSPVSVGGSLSWAVRAMDPVPGLAASAPASDRLTFWNPEVRRTAVWLPGSEPERLLPGSMSALVVDPGNALVTLEESLVRERLGARRDSELVDRTRWVLQPTTLSASDIVGIATGNGQLSIARLTLSFGEPSPR